MSTPTTPSPSKKNARIFFPLPPTIDWKQWAFVWIVQGLAAGLIDGTINFFIAKNMYHYEPNTSFWLFPLPFAGDLGVTCLVQGLATFLIVPTLILPDLANARTSPLPLGPWPRVSHLPDPRSLFDSSSDEITKKKKAGGALGYYSRMLLRFWAEGTENMGLFWGVGREGMRGGVRGWFERLGWSVLQGAAWGAVLFFLFWPISIAILAPIYTHKSMSAEDGHLWAAEISKFVFTFVIGAFQNSLVALQVLGARSNYTAAQQAAWAPVLEDEETQDERTPLITGA